MNAADLGKLRRVAQIRSDLEMKKFSALRAHVVALHSRKQELEAQLAGCYPPDRSFSLAEARLANTIARQTVQAMLSNEAELSRMTERFETGRRAASRAFGRAEVLREFQAMARRDEENRHALRQGGGTISA